MGGLSGFVEDDGYTETAYLAGDAALRPLRFRYRPTVAQELDRYDRGAAKFKERAALIDYAAAWAAGRILDWTLEDQKGAPVAVSAATISNLPQRRFYRLVSVLLGHEAPDADPEWTPEQAEQEWADRQAAEAQCKPLAVYRAERDAKNSPAESRS